MAGDKDPWKRVKLNYEENRIVYAFRHADLTNKEVANALWGFAFTILQRQYPTEKDIILKLTQKLKDKCIEGIKECMRSSRSKEATDKAVELNDLYWTTLKLEAQCFQFDSYMLYLEKDRNPKEKFYQPRRECLMRTGVIQAMQDLIDDKLDMLSVSLPPGVGKTTLEKMFNSAVMGWYPLDFNLFYSHSGDITRMYFDGVYEIISNETEYKWADIFPNLKINSVNAKMETINVGKKKAFASLQCTSVGAKNAGKVRASKFLFVDDVIGGIDEALNRNILDKRWYNYSVDARQRKLDKCKEIIIATRWSVGDVIGRLQKLYVDNPRVKFIAVPDIDPITGKSNFAFDYNGFSVKFFEDQALLMDEISYKCLYKQEPIEREGLLYHSDELRTFQTLPEREPDAVYAICDTKSTGTDFMVVPVFYQYDNDFYLVDCVCDDSTNFDYQINKIAFLLTDYKVQQCEFESNAGGDRLAFDVKQKLENIGWTCNITTKATESNKETRIIANAFWVKKNILFKDKNDYSRKDDYGVMMQWLLTYCITGKNDHDDVPDCLAIFALFICNKYSRPETQIIRGGYWR